MPAPLALPKGLLLGVATSAYQIEGGAYEGGRGVSIWDTFSHQAGKTFQGQTGDVAVDHFHRFREDVALMADLGIEVYRFSVSWPRVLPSGDGEVNHEGLDFYRRLVEELLSAGVEPMVTLFHWDLPQPLQDQGGWAARPTAESFGKYALVVAEALGDRVRWWSTINEPWCAAFLGHASGEHAPGLRDPAAAFAAAHHLNLAHGLAVEAIREQAGDEPRVGIPLNLAPVRGLEDDPLVVDGVRRVDGYRNRLWLGAIVAGAYPEDVLADAAPFGGFPVRPGDLEVTSRPLDWLGINYYHDLFVGRSDRPQWLHPGADGVGEVVPPGPLTDMGWPITPVGLYDLLIRVDRDHQGHPPYFITENGCAYDDPVGPNGAIEDDRRIEYLAAHLGQLSRAIQAGSPVLGYLVWSLLDNFEWAYGYSKRFGLVHVDFETLRRTPRKSAFWFRDVIRRNGSG